MDYEQHNITDTLLIIRKDEMPYALGPSNGKFNSISFPHIKLYFIKNIVDVRNMQTCGGENF